MMDDTNKAAGDTLNTSNPESMKEEGAEKIKQMSPSSLKRYLRKTYGRRAIEMVTRYNRSLYDLAHFINNAAFLMRCRAMRVVPKVYRVECNEIRNTAHVIRILDECSFRLMLADLDYNRLRKVQVSRLLEKLHEKLEKLLSTDDLNCVVTLAKAKYEKEFEDTRETQRSMFADLLKEYEIEQKRDGKEEREE